MDQLLQLSSRYQMLIQKQDYPKALAVLELMIVLKPCADFFLHQGNILKHLGQYNRALKSYQEALVLDSNCQHAKDGIAKICSSLGNLDPTQVDKERTPSSPDKHKYFGRYLILQEIGRGGMGKVYRAMDPQLDREIALKVLIAAEQADQEQIERFLQEARATARLNHPNIVKVYDIGKEGSQNFFTMDYVRGVPLSQYIQKQTLNNRHIMEILLKISQGIQEAHTHKIIHRDLKPSNIIVNEKKQPLVMDFGLAKVVERNSSLSQSGIIMGTPAYMSPEQAQGKTKQVNERSDIYSLGAILYQMITKRAPFQGTSSINIVLQVIEKDPVPPKVLNPEIDIELETICLKCLEKDAEHRYGNVQHLVKDIERYLNNEPIKARPASLFHKLKKWAQRNRSVAIVVIVASVLLVGVVFLLQWQFNISKHREMAKNAEEIVKKATTLKKQGNYRDSIAEFKRIPTKTVALYKKAQKNIKQMQKSVENSFSQAKSWEKIAEDLWDKKKFQKAIAAFEKSQKILKQILKWDPRHIQTLSKLPKIENKKLKLSLQRRAKARFSFDKAMFIVNSPSSEKYLTACLNLLNKAIHTDSAFAEAYYQRGRVYQRLLRHQKSLSDYQRCIDITKKEEQRPHTGAQYYRTLMQLALGKEKVLKNILKGILRAPSKAIDDPYLLLTKAYASIFSAKEKGRKQAMFFCNQAQKIAPYFPDTYILRAMSNSYFRSEYFPGGFRTMKQEDALIKYEKNSEQALLDIGTYLNLVPNAPMAKFLRGIILAQLGDFANAQKDLEIAMQKVDLSKLRLYERSVLSYCLIAQQKYYKAIAEIDKELKRIPHNSSDPNVVRRLVVLYLAQAMTYLLANHPQKEQKALANMEKARRIELQAKHPKGYLPSGHAVTALLLIAMGQEKKAGAILRSSHHLLKNWMATGNLQSMMNFVNIMEKNQRLREMMFYFPHVFTMPPAARSSIWLVQRFVRNPKLKTFRPRFLGAEVTVPIRLSATWIRSQPKLRQKFDLICRKETNLKFSMLFAFDMYPIFIDIDALPRLLKFEKLPSATLYYRRAVAHYLNKNLARARKDLQKAIELNPGFMEAHYGLAMLLAMASKKEPLLKNQALLHLWISIELGWKHPEYTKEDFNFRSLYNLPQFHTILKARPVPLTEFSEMENRYKNFSKKKKKLIYQILKSRFNKEMEKKQRANKNF